MRQLKSCLVALATGSTALLTMSHAVAASADDAEALAQANWREAIARVVAPAEGCFEAAYPTTTWSRVQCVVAPNKPYVPHGHAQTVGDGNDYAAASTGGLTQSAVGSFPKVTGVTSEKDGVANVYSLQLNSNFMDNSQACTGHSGCLAWSQFVYGSIDRSVFMQYWLINWNATCAAGWNTYATSTGNDCYKNSAAVSAPLEPIANLSTLKISATAVDGGLDTLVFTAGTKAYTTTGSDTVTYLAEGWTQSEFNIIGDGGGSKASFNKGSTVEVEIQVNNGTTNAPTCITQGGTTGETNNLNLGKCITRGGAQPAMGFVQSN